MEIFFIFGKFKFEVASKKIYDRNFRIFCFFISMKIKSKIMFLTGHVAYLLYNTNYLLKNVLK